MNLIESAIACISKNHPTCFVAGTLVHTQNGLVPIEQIKVGDLVLSKPEAGGELAYKPVTQTFIRHQQQVVAVPMISQREYETLRPNRGTQLQRAQRMLVMTPEHPVGTVYHGWQKAENLGRGNLLSLSNGAYAEVTEPAGPVLMTANPLHGLHSVGASFDNEYGQLIDFSRYPVVDFSQFDIDFEYGSSPPEMLHTVYNIEVADYHTYFVGDLYDYDDNGQPVGEALGVWVHNTCAEFELFKKLEQQPPKTTDAWREWGEAYRSGLPSNLVSTDD